MQEKEAGSDGGGRCKRRGAREKERRKEMRLLTQRESLEQLKATGYPVSCSQPISERGSRSEGREEQEKQD